MVTLILGKTLVFWSGILAGTFFFSGLIARYLLGNVTTEKRKRIGKCLLVISIVSVLIHMTLALLSSLFGIWL